MRTACRPCAIGARRRTAGPSNRGSAAPGGDRRARDRGGSALMSQAPAPDKRRAILDAAITVFARQGFHSARVSDVAAEAGRRLRARLPLLRLQGADAQRALLRALEAAPRGEPGDAAQRRIAEGQAAGRLFIIESYRHEPELMKVIIVEVTGRRTPSAEPTSGDPRRPTTSSPGSSRRSGDRRVPRRRRSRLRRDALLRGDRAAPLRLDLRPRSRHRRDYEEAKQLVVETICEARTARWATGSRASASGQGGVGKRPSARTVLTGPRSSRTCCSGSSSCRSGCSGS